MFILWEVGIPFGKIIHFESFLVNYKCIPNYWVPCCSTCLPLHPLSMSASSGNDRAGEGRIEEKVGVKVYLNNN
jgi:hypothetical protein